MTYVHAKPEKPWHDGWQLYLLLCFSLAALYALPAEYKGIGAAGVLVVIAVSPAIGKRGKSKPNYNKWASKGKGYR